jgi:hypothetical protein
MRLGQNACLGNCLDEFDKSGERSRAMMALWLDIVANDGNIFDSIIIKFGQDACVDNRLDEFEHGSFWMKNKVTGAKNRKFLLTLVLIQVT